MKFEYESLRQDSNSTQTRESVFHKLAATKYGRLFGHFVARAVKKIRAYSRQRFDKR